MRKMFEYEICNVFDTTIFEKQGKALLKHIPGLKRKNKVEDVDGSQLNIFVMPDQAEITVVNDVDFGVYIKSDFDIRPYFKQ